jgi:hypothetical protein
MSSPWVTAPVGSDLPPRNGNVQRYFSSQIFPRNTVTGSSWKPGREIVFQSGKLDAAWSQRLYRIVNVLQYTKAKRPPGYKLAPTCMTAPNQREPGYYRAEALQPVLVRNNQPVENQLAHKQWHACSA